MSHARRRLFAALLAELLAELRVRTRDPGRALLEGAQGSPAGVVPYGGAS